MEFKSCMETMELRDTFRGKRVLVLGHTGFKGAWLTLWLKKLGAQVSGYALPPNTDPSLFDKCRLNEKCESEFGDIRDSKKLGSFFKRIEPEIVFHLAAQPLVRYSYDHPVFTFETNVMGTVNVLEAARNTPSVRAIVVATTDKCYINNNSGTAFKEVDPLGGSDPYSASKACAEMVVNAYAQSFLRSQKVATARAGNVIGGGDWSEDRILADCVREWSLGKVLSVRNPEATRPWQHVLDCLHGYLQLAVALLSDARTQNAYNFGPQDQHSVRELLNEMKSTWRGESNWIHQGSDSTKKEAMKLHLDSELARRELKWRPHLNFSKMCKFTTTWYQDYYEFPENAEELCLTQILNFENLTTLKFSASPERTI